MAWTPHRNRRKRLATGAVVAGLIAAVSIVAVESTGTLLTETYSGLGGKLAPSEERVQTSSIPVVAAPY